jgi:hypothetical protein
MFTYIQFLKSSKLFKNLIISIIFFFCCSQIASAALTPQKATKEIRKCVPPERRNTRENPNNLFVCGRGKVEYDPNVTKYGDVPHECRKETQDEDCNHTVCTSDAIRFFCALVPGPGENRCKIDDDKACSYGVCEASPDGHGAKCVEKQGSAVFESECSSDSDCEYTECEKNEDDIFACTKKYGPKPENYIECNESQCNANNDLVCRNMACTPIKYGTTKHNEIPCNLDTDCYRTKCDAKEQRCVKTDDLKSKSECDINNDDSCFYMGCKDRKCENIFGKKPENFTECSPEHEDQQCSYNACSTNTGKCEKTNKQAGENKPNECNDIDSTNECSVSYCDGITCGLFPGKELPPGKNSCLMHMNFKNKNGVEYNESCIKTSCSSKSCKIEPGNGGRGIFCDPSKDEKDKTNPACYHTECQFEGCKKISNQSDSKNENECTIGKDHVGCNRKENKGCVENDCITYVTYGPEDRECVSDIQCFEMPNVNPGRWIEKWREEYREWREGILKKLFPEFNAISHGSYTWGNKNNLVAAAFVGHFASNEVRNGFLQINSDLTPLVENNLISVDFYESFNSQSQIEGFLRNLLLCSAEQDKYMDLAGLIYGRRLYNTDADSVFQVINQENTFIGLDMDKLNQCVLTADTQYADELKQQLDTLAAFTEINDNEKPLLILFNQSGDFQIINLDEKNIMDTINKFVDQAATDYSATIDSNDDDSTDDSSQYDSTDDSSQYDSTNDSSDQSGSMPPINF